MRATAWRWLIVGGLVGGSVAAAAGCSSSNDNSAGSGNTTSSGATGGTGAAGKGTGGTTGGTGGTTGGTGGTGGSSATGGTGGSSAGMGGSGGSSGAATGGSAGKASAGAPGGGMGGTGAAGMTSSGGAPSGGMAGSLGSGGAAAGNGGGGMPAMLVTPIMRSATSYVLEFGNTYFEVNPMVGARVTNVHLKGGMNLLGAGKDADNMGSTFWPSPQANWTWPPTDSTSIANINNQPYTASNDDTSMTFVGMPASVVGLSVTKKFTADVANEAIVATYTMIGTASGKSAAPWEITRFAQSGVTFFKSGGTVATAKPMAQNMDSPPTMDAAGCTWLKSPGTFASMSSKDQLLTVNGAGGWLAHADGNWVVVKKFTATPANMIATGEGEIDIYMNNPGNSGNPTPYMEVEEQGPYGAVGQNMMVNWTVTWFVRPLPTGATVMPGDQTLASYVQSLVQ